MTANALTTVFTLLLLPFPYSSSFTVFFSSDCHLLLFFVNYMFIFFSRGGGSAHQNYSKDEIDTSTLALGDRWRSKLLTRSQNLTKVRKFPTQKLLVSVTQFKADPSLLKIPSTFLSSNSRNTVLHLYM